MILIFDNLIILNCRTQAHPSLIENYMKFSEHDHLHTGKHKGGNDIEEFFGPTSPGVKRPTFNSEISTFEESAPITNGFLGGGGRRGALNTMIGSLGSKQMFKEGSSGMMNLLQEESKSKNNAIRKSVYDLEQLEAECELLPTNLLITLKAHESTGRDHRTSLQFNNDGTLIATGGCDNAVRLWNVKSGEQIS